MDMKQRLAEYHDEVTRWEKVTYREVKSESGKKKAVRGKRSVLFVDTSVLRKMLDPLSKSTNRIAYLIMDECWFGSNEFYATYKEIGEALQMSGGSVIQGMAELQSVDFIRKFRNGKWMLNPQVGAKCYAEDVNKLNDIYSKLERYQPKKTKGAHSNESD